MGPETLRGHLDALILAVVDSGPAHGYAIMEALRERSGGSIDLPTGTLYPALRRLERAGLMRSSWATVNGRRRRTYELTAAGRRRLAGEVSEWRQFIAAVDGVFGRVRVAGEG